LHGATLEARLGLEQRRRGGKPPAFPRRGTQRVAIGQHAARHGDGRRSSCPSCARLAAMHATDALAPHRRLAARVAVTLAVGLAARREAQVAAPGVSARQRCRRTGHGIAAGLTRDTPLPGRRAQGREIERAGGLAAGRGE